MNHQERDFIEEVLAGDLSEDSPDFRKALEDNPELQVELDEVRALMDQLEGEATAEREAATMPAPVASAPAREKATQRPPFGLLAAAAAILAVFMLNGLFSDDKPLSNPGNPDTLGTSSDVFQELSPMGSGASFAEFRGTGKIPSHMGITLRIWDDADSLAEQPTWTHVIQEAERTPDGFQWTPSSEVLALLPDSIRWEILLVRIGNSGFSDPVEVWASR